MEVRRKMIREVCSPAKPCGTYLFRELKNLPIEKLRKIVGWYGCIMLLRDDADDYRMAPPESPEGKEWNRFCDKLAKLGLELDRVEDNWIVFA